MIEKTEWTLAKAKACFSEVVDRAQAAPQLVTRRGKPLAVIVSVAEWDNKTRRRGTLSEFFRTAPLRDDDVEVERVKDKPRDVAL